MSEMKRHAGKLKNTDRKVVVVFMQLPGDPSNCLVVDTDSLPPIYHDELMRIVEHEGQNEVVLAEILGRRKLSHTGKDMMLSLHEAGFLQKMPISNVIMCPLPNRGIPLEDIIKMTGGVVPESKQTHVTNPENVPNRFIENQIVDANDVNSGIANNLIVEANMLIAEAESKFRRATEIVPNLAKTLNATFNKIAPKTADQLMPKYPDNPNADDSTGKRGRGRPKKEANL